MSGAFAPSWRDRLLRCPWPSCEDGRDDLSNLRLDEKKGRGLRVVCRCGTSGPWSGEELGSFESLISACFIRAVDRWNAVERGPSDQGVAEAEAYNCGARDAEFLKGGEI